MQAGLKPSPEVTPKSASVEVNGVNYAFGHGESRKQVLFNNVLALYPGELTIMTGPSGSGKTTLLTLIGALRNIQEGSIMVFGRELKGLKPAEQELVRSNIGFIFQTHNLMDSLTAYQNVKLATELHRYENGEADRRTGEILTRMGLEDRMNYKPHKLSTGQSQRVAICRALVNKPGIILADEPTAALDKDTGRHVVETLYNFTRTAGCTVMIVTHDTRIIDVADRIVTMVDGCVASDVGFCRPG